MLIFENRDRIPIDRMKGLLLGPWHLVTPGFATIDEILQLRHSG
ncbi:MAG: hypothetical protein ACR2OU_05530 [Thermomicrobiales bacterium]